MSPRNAMPSLHFAWAAILWRSTAGARASIRVTAGTLVLLTVVATIGLGEHYVVDLIAAVPFIVALEAICAHRSVSLRQRFAPLTAGVGFFVVWIVVVRNAEAVVPTLFSHTLAVWLLTIITLSTVLSVALRHLPRRPVYAGIDSSDGG